MNLWGSFQYRAARHHENLSPSYKATQRTIVVQARNVEFDFRP
jgi:hypothetical protein